MTRIRLIVWAFAFASVSGCGASAAQTITAMASGAGCAAVRGVVSRTICSDQELARLNREMRGLYRRAQASGDRHAQILAHWHWIIERNKTCGRKQASELRACVVQSYNVRMAELRHALEQGRAPVERMAAIAPPPSVSVSPAKSATLKSATASSACANQIGPVDRAICNDVNLGHWEERLGKLYQQALDDPLIRTILTDDQARWTAERGKSCVGPASNEIVDCVLRMTKRRVEELALVINARDDPQDRAAKVEKILSGRTAPPPGLDADTIDRESERADQSELVLADARTCIRKNAGPGGTAIASDDRKLEEAVSTICFGDFSKRMSALELGALAKSSFQMLVRQELSVSKLGVSK